MRLLKQKTAANIMVFMTDLLDHVSGKESLALTVSISKNGGPFGVIDPIITERGDGWYNIALIPDDTNTLGDLAIHIVGSGADDSDLITQVTSMLDAIEIVRKLTGNNVTKAGDVITIYDDNGTSIWREYNLSLGGRIEV